jgi:D-serine deaminase-like pyridoxal phosphate-dependent protein
VLAQAGVRDILIANQIVDPAKIVRMAGLARNGSIITVAVDNKKNIGDMSEAACMVGTTLHVLVEINVGMNRCGVDEPADALDLARRVSSLPGLKFDGLQAYEGHLSTLPGKDERHRGVAEMIQKVTCVKELIEKDGLPIETISGGGTGTYEFTGNDTIWTEIQAGSYALMDGVYAAAGAKFQFALTVLSMVIHKRPGAAVTDAGLKVCSGDEGAPSILEHPGLRVELHEEHGLVEDSADELQYRQKVEYIPAHCCTTVNLHDRYWCMRGGALESVWPIPGRGKSQ